MRHLAVTCMLAVLVAACSSGGSGGGGGTTGPAAGTPAGATQAPAGGDTYGGGSGGGLGGVDPAGLATLSSEKVCTLLSADEAGAILGSAVDGAPSGMTIPDLGTNCIYTGGGDSPATIKVEFNTLGYKTQADIFRTQDRSTALTVAGRQAFGVESPNDPTSFFNQAQLVVSLADDSTATALYVEAPTLDKAKQVAEKVVPRIGGLK